MVRHQKIFFIITFSLLINHQLLGEGGTVTQTAALTQQMAEREFAKAILEEKLKQDPEDEQTRKELEAMKANDPAFKNATKQAQSNSKKAGTQGSEEAFKRGPGGSREEASKYRKAYEGTRSTDGTNPLTGKKIEDSIAGENAKVKEMYDFMEQKWQAVTEDHPAYPRKQEALESIQNARQEQTYSDRLAKAMDTTVEKHGGDYSALEQTPAEKAAATEYGEGFAKVAQAARIISEAESGAFGTTPSTGPKNSVATTPEPPKFAAADPKAYLASYDASTKMAPETAMQGSTLTLAKGKPLPYTGMITIPGKGLVHTWGGQYAYLADGTYYKYNQLATW